LERVLEFCTDQDYRAEIIVVDDGSEDHTAELAEAFAARYPQVYVIRNEHRGKAYTVRTGMLQSRGQYVMFSDADLSTPIEEVTKILSWLERGYDVVIGSREGVGAQRYNEPFYRHLMGRVFNWISRALTVRGIQDTQCGFKAFRTMVAHDLFSRVRLYSENAPVVSEPMVTGFDVEVLFLAQKRGYKIKEVPVEWYYSNETKVNPFKDSWRNLHDVLRVRWNDLKGIYNE